MTHTLECRNTFKYTTANRNCYYAAIQMYTNSNVKTSQCTTIQIRHALFKCTAKDTLNAIPVCMYLYVQSVRHCTAHIAHCGQCGLWPIAFLYIAFRVSFVVHLKLYIEVHTYRNQEPTYRNLVHTGTYIQEAGTYRDLYVQPVAFEM